MRASRIFALARTMRCASVGGRGEERARDLLGREAADLAQRQRDLRVRRQRRVAAGEDQPQPVVLDALVVPLGAAPAARPRAARRRPSSEASNRARRRMRVDRLEAAGRNQPGARVGRHALARPLLDRRGERVVQRLLGEVEVAEQADQRGEDAARLGAVDRLDRLARAVDRVASLMMCRGRG